MIKHIVFDLDGTLIDSLKIFIEIGNNIAIKYGYNTLNEDKVKELMLLPMRKRLEVLNIPIYKVPKLSIEVLNNFKLYISRIKPIEGIEQMLRSLYDTGYELSIISSNSLQNINLFLEVNKLQIFKNVYSSKGLFSKNVSIKKLIAEAGVKKDEVIYVGDEQRDIEACKKIGIKIISVTWGFDSLDLLVKANADYIVSKPKEINEIINKINTVGF